MITKENAKEWLPLVAALAEGKRIHHISSLWGDCGQYFSLDTYHYQPSNYRIAPEPRKVPLTADDIPAVCWVRENDGRTVSYLITSVGDEGVHSGIGWLGFDTLKAYEYQYSSDRKNWLPCWKEVAE